MAASHAPKLRAPPGACDTHMHFYDAAVPAASGASMPGDYTLPMSRALQQRLGLERVIVVQPNGATRCPTTPICSTSCWSGRPTRRCGAGSSWTTPRSSTGSRTAHVL